MNLLSYILWNPDLEAFHLGPITLVWSVMDYRTGTGFLRGAASL